MFRKEFSEILSGDTDVNIIVHLYGNTDSIALSDAETAGKYHLVFQVMILHGFFKKRYYIGRAFQIARQGLNPCGTGCKRYLDHSDRPVERE